VRLQVRAGQPITPLRRLHVQAEHEPPVLVAELVSGVADVIAARATQTRVRPTQRAREVGPLNLSEALQLTALIARRDRGSAGAGTRCRGSPAGLEESAGASLDEAVLAV